MAKDTSIAGLVGHYAHVTVALTDSRKGMGSSDIGHEAALAVDHTIKGLCGLIDALVADEHKNIPSTGAH